MPESQLAKSTIGWPTKAEAARALGVSTKTIEKYVEQKKLRQEMQSQINKPARAVIDPETLERMVSERSQVRPAEPSQDGSSLVVRELLESFASREMPLSELRQKIYLTEDEAIRLTGCGRGWVRRNLPSYGRIGPHGAVMYHRKDLEEL